MMIMMFLPVRVKDHTTVGVAKEPDVLDVEDVASGRWPGNQGNWHSLRNRDWDLVPKQYVWESTNQPTTNQQQPILLLVKPTMMTWAPMWAFCGGWASPIWKTWYNKPMKISDNLSPSLSPIWKTWYERMKLFENLSPIIVTVPHLKDLDLRKTRRSRIGSGLGRWLRKSGTVITLSSEIEL